MCFPMAIPLVLAAAGTAMQYFGAQKAENAQERRFAAEQMRQRNLTGEQQGFFEDSLGEATQLTDESAQKKAVEKRNAPLQAAIAPVDQGAYLPGSDSAPQIVQTAAERSVAGQKADASQLALALANLGSTNDMLFDTGIETGRNAGRIGQVGSFMRGSAAALQPELDAAAHKGSFLRGLGSLAQSIGTAMAGAPGGGGLDMGALNSMIGNNATALKAGLAPKPSLAMLFGG